MSPLDLMHRAWLARSLCVLSIAILGATLAIVLLGRASPLPDGFYPQWDEHIVRIVGAAGAPLLGWLIASRRPENPYGWLWCGFGFALALLLAGQATTAYFEATSEGSSLLGPVLVISSVAWSLVYGLVPSLIFLFPDGRMPSRRWRFLAWTQMAAVGVLIVTGPLVPGESGIVSVENPYGIDGPAGQVIEGLVLGAVFVVFGCTLLAAFSLLLRYRVAGYVQRQQIKWFAYAAVFFCASLVFSGFLGREVPGVGQSILEAAVQAGLYAAIAIAILRHGLYDIDFIINRTLVYGLLTILVAGLYAFVVGGIGALAQTDGLLLSLLAAGFVAVIFAPLRDRLQRGVNRLMYGDRDDPYRALSRLGRSLEMTLTPNDVYPSVVRTVQEALRLPYTALTTKANGQYRIQATSGTAGADCWWLPLTYQGNQVGELILGLRPGEDEVAAVDRQLVEALCRQIGVAVHAIQLTDDLQRARELLVTTREEERRRLRHDLHDGLGPALASMSLQVGTVSRLIPDKPEALDLLTDLKTQMQDALAEIRRIVYGLRPPILDELGLVEAIDEYVARYRGAGSSGGLCVQTEAPQDLPPLPAAVEVAAYWIAMEALTNVAKHASAQSCLIRLSVSDAMLEIEVTDDGRGITPGARSGTGMISMRERAEELGGTFQLDATASGTTLRACLPLRGTDG